MKARKRPPKAAVAYIRVSTEEQGRTGIGLEGQLAAIEAYSSAANLQIMGVYEDVASGMGPDSIRKRPKLQAAIEHAKADGLPILVCGLDRFSRHTASMEATIRQNKLTIISTSDGELTNPVVLASRAARAQREGEFISQKTKEALQSKKVEGVRLGNPRNLDEAQKRGAAANKERAKRIIEQIADVLVNDHARDWSAPRIAELLDKKGVKTGSGRTWTVDALRRPLKEAKNLLDERQAQAMTSLPNFGRF